MVTDAWRRRSAWFLVALAACATARPFPPAVGDQTMPRPALRQHAPALPAYLAPRRQGSIAIDGHLDDAGWRHVPWTGAFVDIEGSVRPRPRFRTRVRMTWDDTYWYIAAELREPDVWATITTRDAVIFRDNDFELFVDPSGSTHRYFEVETNALATVWDLFLAKPYRDGGHADNAWNITGLRIATSVDGTLNDPHDRDRGWTVEMAIPWSAFSDSSHNRTPPIDGEQWRVNFSRVEWDVDTTGDRYTKRTRPAGAPLPEHNWVWAPQGAVDIHLPEMWGVVQFGGTKLLHDDAASNARWQLRRVYYAERDYQSVHHQFTAARAALGLTDLPVGLVIDAAGTTWHATIAEAGTNRRWHIEADGRVWRE